MKITILHDFCKDFNSNAVLPPFSQCKIESISPKYKSELFSVLESLFMVKVLRCMTKVNGLVLDHTDVPTWYTMLGVELLDADRPMVPPRAVSSVPLGQSCGFLFRLRRFGFGR